MDKECQANFINHRKGGQAFINLVTIIPIAGGVHNTPEEADEVVYHVGFQVDLTEQPNATLRRLWDRSYIVNYGAGAPAVPSLPAPPPRKRKAIISKNLQALLSDPAFVDSLPISTSTIAPTSENTHEKSQLLNLIPPISYTSYPSKDSSYTSPLRSGTYLGLRRMSWSGSCMN